MKPPRFVYERPQTLPQALALLTQHGGDASILSGGQSLMPMLNLRMAQPSVLVDINRIPELDLIELRDQRLMIGARARHNEVLRSQLVAEHAPLLRLALPFVAHDAIRNRGTFGGSLALADPAAEMPACAICLDADIVAASEQGERRIPAVEFFHGLYTTALEPEEMIVRIEIPSRSHDWVHAFDEISRRHGDFAIAGLAMALQIADDRLADCRIVYLGVESQPRRLEAIEKELIGSTLSSPEALERMLHAFDGLNPMETGDYPGSYRLRLARTLLSRLLSRCLEACDVC